MIPSLKPLTRILLVDDVITRGRTLAAAAMRLHEAFPNAEIRAFALVRAMNFVLDVPRLAREVTCFVKPCAQAII